ncbi:MAG TPA: hypothetical protein PLG03_01825 [Bacteroidales bacterium]|nr:hypothetical protein [Bacteroidales bacterium]
MDLQTLSRLIKDLITVNDRVSLPGMGGFVTEIAPSVFSDKARVINPPFRRVLFRMSETWNDQLLENLYADEADITLEEAANEIESFIKDLRSDLNRLKSIQLPGFGTMKATDKNDYFFVADKDLFIYPEAFGLEPLNIKILPKRGSLEILKKTSAKPKKKHRLGLILLIILVILIIIIALMVFFKEEIRPVWEWILYSREERELLKLL